MCIDFKSDLMARRGLADCIEVKLVRKARSNPAAGRMPNDVDAWMLDRMEETSCDTVSALVHRMVDGCHNKIKPVEDLIWIIQFSIGTDAKLHAMKDPYPTRELLVQRSKLVGCRSMSLSFKPLARRRRPWLVIAKYA